MNYNGLLGTVSLPLFIIRICEEEGEEITKAPRLWECAWICERGNTDSSFSANAAGVVSTVCNENFHVLINVFHSFFQMFSFFFVHPLWLLVLAWYFGNPCSGKPGRGYRAEEKIHFKMQKDNK